MNVALINLAEGASSVGACAVPNTAGDGRPLRQWLGTLTAWVVLALAPAFAASHAVTGVTTEAPMSVQRADVPGVERAPPLSTLPGSRTLKVGPGETIRTIAEAARQAHDGDTVEIAAGDYRGDVALWLQKRLTIRAVGGPARLFADGRIMEGKAIWVIRDGHFDITGIHFVGAKVPDRNGAGIRFENGHLIVRDCVFRGNDTGLLTASGERHRTARLEVENSEFAHNGVPDHHAHQLYVGNIELLRVTGSYFHHAHIGHLLKSRAKVNEIRYNRLTDESGGRASYEIDLPNGGVAVVIGNIIQQARTTENLALVSYGREGYAWKENRLYLMNNTMVNDHLFGGAFLRAADGADSIMAMNNLLVGRGRYHAPDVLQVRNDVDGDRHLFLAADRHDYRLSDLGRKLAWQRPAPTEHAGMSLVPRAEYVHPRQWRALAAEPRHPGAIQD